MKLRQIRVRSNRSYKIYYSCHTIISVSILYIKGKIRGFFIL
uniref:Uncharacterized protein n=1 Tax=Siphoviridae sp. ctMOb8 TaxID=2825460 RepID=A0A8S5PYR5_9CAUD|nr:MAG TPA: hypothetical protein [Siphoviridae sp. ctMOb8]DAT24581.1 MAG TPA: hypothetical protein [Caudoviricetes sp.]DAW58581.1 MAG TPA: hypothetical protein [Caudoviricetes sp.]